jgi:peptidoglycan/LPS O-acetylase OafA/YrhL
MGPLRYVGRISYGLYLYHFPIFFFLGLPAARGGRPGSFPVGRGALAVALALALAVASYELIERPLLRLRDRFRGPATPASSAQ